MATHLFTVKEDAEGRPWLVAGPVAGAGLEVSNIRFSLRPTATIEDAHDPKRTWRLQCEMLARVDLHQWSVAYEF